jgi:peptidoglycan/xylan/chitin deacetylase (PgdA/CDA1 family)
MILTFHALDDRRSVISFSAELFRHGMAKLHKNGYQTVSLLEAVDCIRHGRSFSERSFVMTFDDGYESVYEEAFPVLQEFGMIATIFLTVGETGRAKSEEKLPSLEGRSMLSWREIEEMKQCGMEFGAHTLTHPDLTNIPRDRIEAEICDSKKIIENMLSAPISCFAYPYGRYNDTIRELVQRHFTCACSDKLGLVHPHSNPFTLERVEMYYFRTPNLFNLMWTKFLPWYLLVRKVPRSVKTFLNRD